MGELMLDVQVETGYLEVAWLDWPVTKYMQLL